jgi:DNA-binding NtrC family response regulator
MQPIKVLIVDDEPDFTEILADRLRSWGFSVAVAANDLEVLETIAQDRPDVVLISLQSGQGRGLDTLRIIKDRDQSIEVLLLTGKGTALAGMAGMRLGAFDCLPQPLELGLLIDKIKTACGQGRESPPRSSLALAAPTVFSLAGDGSCGWLWSEMVSLLDRLLL